MSPTIIISRAIVAGGLTGARPALTLALLQIYARWFHEPDLPEGFEWIIHEYAIIAVAAAAVVEHFVRTDPDFEEMMEYPNMAIGLLVSIMLSVLVLSIGGEMSQVEAVTASGASGQGLEVLRAGWPEGVLGLQGLTVLASVLASLGLGWVRRKAMTTLAGVSISERWGRWIETGTVIGAVTTIALVPVLAVALAVVLVVAGVVVGATIWVVGNRVDARARTACACGHRVRKEASVCPKCGAELEPETKLGQPWNAGGSPGLRGSRTSNGKRARGMER